MNLTPAMREEQSEPREIEPLVLRVAFRDA
jgi:hypothetical protein